MKKLIVLFLCFVMILSSCSVNEINITETEESVKEFENTFAAEDNTFEFEGLNDPELMRYVEDKVFLDTVEILDSEDYVIENVSSIYISKEYLEETAYNSKSNIYFGYTLDELNEIFSDKRYIYTLGTNGETKVTELEEITPLEIEPFISNILIGSGIILTCVTISKVVPVAGAAAAFSAIVVSSAKSAAQFALGTSAISALSAGIITAGKTGDIKKAIEAASEGFKCGAISGAISGVLSGGIKEAFVLKKGTSNGLKMTEVAKIQHENKLPMEVVQDIRNIDEYNVYVNEGIKGKIIDNRLVLSQDIDLSYKSKLSDGTVVTNLQRMQNGCSPLDSTDRRYNLHHIGQKNNGFLAILKDETHKKYDKILHIKDLESEIDRNKFDKYRQTFWKAYAELVA